MRKLASKMEYIKLPFSIAIRLPFALLKALLEITEALCEWGAYYMDRVLDKCPTVKWNPEYLESKVSEARKQARESWGKGMTQQTRNKND